MKVLKSLFLVLVVLCLLVAIIALQMQLVMRQTLLNPKHFEKAYDKSDITEAISEVILREAKGFGSTIAGEGGQESTEGMDVDIAAILDMDWVEEHIEKLSKGMYAYITGTKRSLPTIDLKPVKKMLLEGVTEQMLQQDDIMDDLQMMDDLVRAYEQFIGEISEDNVSEEGIKLALQMSDMDGEGLEGELVKEMIVATASVDPGLSPKERKRAIIKEIVNGSMGIEDIKNKLDLNDLMDTIYPGGSNPLEAVRGLLSALRTMLFQGLLVLVALLVLMVIMTAFRLSSILGWLSAPLCIGGLFGLGTGLLGYLMPGILMQGVRASIQETGISGTMVSFMDIYVKGIMRLSMMLGGLLLVVGILFAVLAGVLGKHMGKKDQQEGKKGLRAVLMAIRIVVVLALMAGIYLNGRWCFNKVNDAIIEVRRAAQESTMALEDGDWMDAVVEVTNAKFLDPEQSEAK